MRPNPAQKRLRAQSSSRRQRIALTGACALLTQLGAAGSARGGDEPGASAVAGEEASPHSIAIVKDERWGASLSLGVDALAAGTRGDGARGGLRPYIDGEGWIGWTAAEPDARAPGLGLFSPSMLDARRGLIVRAGAAGLAAARSTGGARAFEWRVAESATLQLTPVVLEQRFSYQRPVEFTDRFWRSQRGVMSVGGRFALPGMFTVLPAKVNLMSLAVEADVLRYEEGTTQRDLGVELVVVEFFDRSPERPVRAAIIDLNVAQQDAPFKRGEEGRTNLAALTIELDVLSLAGISLSRRLSLGARGGIGIAVPTHLYDATLPPEAPSSEEGEKESVPSVMTPTIFGDLVYRSTALPFVPSWSSLDRYVAGERGPGAAIGAGTFSRLDPTGSAGDVGGQIAAEGRVAITREIYAGGSGTVVMAKRVVVSDLGVPEGAPRAGDMIFMTRVAAQLEWEITRGVTQRASAFIERSDRDDPVGLGGAPSASLRPRWGATVSLAATVF
ncbi:uncharacterized protein SOCE836_020390 [Sorangium cellulosum]|uniref:Uncharacterized protein n=2 Tax=Polyangiaceae TaxID=49 RepID=A0A4P2QJ12_SORCE|nr:uncharacterized protein SOCE836_020390 [Sorangium cellulosum]WCQ89333.1 hypothetical protein NQZ70_02020 [Sorangium sp. Soce836]